MPSTISAGTTAGTAIAIAGDTTGNLAFQTNGTTTAMTITTAQRVGINKSSPDTILNIGFTGPDAVNTFRIEGSNGSSERYAFDIQADGANTATRFMIGSGGGAPIERMRITSAGDLQFNSGYGSVATAYGCRAWVEFNGTGTVSIRASGNVSSVTDNGTGDYTVNFATAMPDANYSIVGTGSDHGAWGSLFHTAANAGGGGTNPTTSNCRVLLSNNNGTSRVDDGFVNVAVFR